MGQETSLGKAADPLSLRTSDGAHEGYDVILSLPRELRDLVYHHAWEGTHIYYRELGWGVDVRYLDALGACAAPSKLPAWLLTHPQVLVEGLEQFYVHAEFSVGSKCSCTKWI